MEFSVAPKFRRHIANSRSRLMAQIEVFDAAGFIGKRFLDKVGLEKADSQDRSRKRSIVGQRSGKRHVLGA